MNVNFTGIMVGSWANPHAVFSRDTQGYFLLSIQDENLFSVQGQGMEA